MRRQRLQKPSLASLEDRNLDYDAYWRYRPRDQLQERYRVMAGQIAPGSSLLDIGCGDGTNLGFLVDSLHARGVGIDVSREAVALTQQKGLTAVVADVADPEWQLSEDFDFIIASEILEHLPCPERVIEKIQHRFRHRLLITIPNIAYYPYRLQMMRGRFPIQWGYHPSEHLRFWSISDFELWVQNFDLEIAEIIPVDGTRHLFQRFPNLFGHQVVYVLRSTRADQNGAPDESGL